MKTKEAVMALQKNSSAPQPAAQAVTPEALAEAEAKAAAEAEAEAKAAAEAEAEAKAAAEAALAAKIAGIEANNEAAAKAAEAEAKARAKEDQATMKQSGAKEVKVKGVEPGQYRSKRFKMHDPYTNLTFSPSRPTTVGKVTSWFACQVQAGLLIRCGD
jgi:membrane protein involved in colicin uptake